MRRLTLIGLGLVLTSFSAYAQESGVFKSEIAGFEITKPADWQFVTAEQNLENLKNTQVGDKDFQAAMVKYATAPLVAMAKHSEPFNDVNPTLKVNIKPFGPLKGTAPTKILGILVTQFEKVFQDLEIVTPPTAVKVSGLDAGYIKMNYTLQVPDGTSFPTTSELWIVPRGDYFFMIGSGTRQDEATGSRKEIQAIVDTVVIRP